MEMPNLKKDCSALFSHALALREDGSCGGVVDIMSGPRAG